MRNKTVRIAVFFLFCILALLASGGCGARDAVLTEIEQLDETQQADVVFVTIQHEDGTGCDFYAYRRESGGQTGRGRDHAGRHLFFRGMLWNLSGSR